ncbi:MAG: DUF4160 domain-containing protein [Thermoleophilia bacterium]|nr:DUF4160 domain-containing protein [Thermoleophilia bacterium]
MPTILRRGPYRFFFYAADRDEPPHIHVECGDGTAKLWLSPVRLVRSRGLSPGQLREMQALVEGHGGTFRRSWHEYFGG